MQYRTFIQRLAQWLLVATLLGAGFAMAQSEPTMGQIYATAQAGKLDDAQVMIQQVLLAHPKSSKALFVQAELYARQGKLDNARASLASAESLTPGLPFAKPDAVRALRTQLAARPVITQSSGNTSARYAAPQTQTSASSSSSWVMPLVLAGGVMVAAYFFFRRRNPQPAAQQAAYGNGNSNGLNGPQAFGMGGGGYPQQGYPQQGYPQQAGTGLGGRIMGGVATGLAVGAGVMAAEAIGRNLMGGHNNAAAGSQDNVANNNYQAIDANPDMGGANFGVNDAGSWDDGGSSDAGGGSDWDN